MSLANHGFTILLNKRNIISTHLVCLDFYAIPHYLNFSSQGHMRKSCDILSPNNAMNQNFQVIFYHKNLEIMILKTLSY